MGGLTAYVHSHILNNLRQVKEEIQMLFLARAALERAKAFGEVGPIQPLCSGLEDYRMSIDTKKGVIAGYKEVAITVSRRKEVMAAGKKAISLTTGIFHEVL
jgi:hypothetical protein